MAELPDDEALRFAVRKGQREYRSQPSHPKGCKPEADYIIEQLEPLIVARVRAEAVAAERQATYERLLDAAQGAMNEERRLRLVQFVVNNFASVGVAGSVPVATPDASDETRCHRCGGKNCVWAAPSPLWNEVMRGGDINGPCRWSEIICPPCFAELAEAAGVVTPGWRFTADHVLVPLTTVTPSGRVWDEGKQLWVDPVATPTEPDGAFETRTEYGHQTAQFGWLPEYRGIKYATHQREVMFRNGPPLLLDHWSDPDGKRKPFDPQPAASPVPAKQPEER